ncbi:M48 family metallopeptidase [Sphingobacterium sp. HJSM2_6]|uniref:M48 family metallopeptidase n=1 Tax=Sphingobacterium sp. HJSM2_6 TaxID=3366264 RepID=UPI003BEAA5E7
MANFSLEISEIEEPKLFEFINSVAEEVDTSYPTKVVLTHDVNACVYYESSFWNIFLPIKKNLQIGIGLMNILNQQEFKSVLAHEFGHFSQASLRTGNYVYQVNRMLYNFLYKNNSLTEIPKKLKRFNKWIAAGLDFSLLLIVAIQKVLKFQYRQINLSYHELSREMEYHADAIASQVAGSTSTANALMKIPFAAHGLELTITSYEKLLNQNIISVNLFEDHLALMNYIALRNEYPISNGLPCINISNVNKYNRSKIYFENPWNTHPDLKRRVDAIHKAGVKTSNEQENPAILLFENPKTRLESFSELLFKPYLITENPTLWRTETFVKYYQLRIEKDDLSPIYRGYFDICNPYLEEVPSLLKNDAPLHLSLLFSDERLDTLYAWNGMITDLEILDSILSGDIQVDNFTYDQKLYKKIDIPPLKKVIIAELARIERIMKVQLQDIYTFFYQKAILSGQQIKIKTLYEEFKSSQETYLNDFDLYRNMMKQLEVYQVDFEKQTDLTSLAALKKTEQLFKQRLNRLFQKESLKHMLSLSVHEIMERYLNEDIAYDQEGLKDFNQEHVNKLMTCLIHFNSLIETIFYQKKKELLDFQSNLLNKLA